MANRLADSADARDAEPGPSLHVFKCCACGKFSGGRCHVVKKTADGTLLCGVQPCNIQIDKTIFATSPHVCHACRARNEAKLERSVCDVCDRNVPAYKLTYRVKRKGGVVHIGSHKAVGFDGVIRSGHCCATCYTKNLRLVNAQEWGERQSDSLEEAPRGRKRRCLVALSPDPVPETSDPEQQQSPAPRDVPPVVGTVGGSTESVTHITETLGGIEKARAETGAMIGLVNEFLSMRRRMHKGLVAVLEDDSKFDVDAFISLHEHVVRLLASEMHVIQQDHRFYTDQLALAKEKEQDASASS